MCKWQGTVKLYIFKQSTDWESNRINNEVGKSAQMLDFDIAIS